MSVGRGEVASSEPLQLDLASASAMPPADVLARLGTVEAGVSSDEARRRLELYGPNILRARGVSALSILVRQVRSYLLGLLLFAAVVSAVVGDRTEALIISGIMAMSIGLSFFNEYRSEKAVEALHSQIRHLAFVERDGLPVEVNVTEIVPGDVVHLRVGDVVPADLRLLAAHELECDESVLTGESQLSAKTADARPLGDSPLDLPSCAFMGTIVRGGDGRGLVVRTGAHTAFGAIAMRLGERQGQTAFQQGLQAFSRLLATVTVVLAGLIFVINVALGRSVLQSALFALAIAVGLTPQLLPAIVTVSLATGARRLARRRVIVKRLVCIEDLGNVQVLFTDKTGTLTEGRISFTGPLDCLGRPDDLVGALGLACSDKAGNELDRALWAAAEPSVGNSGAWPTLDLLPFDHERQLASVLVDTPDGRRLIITKEPPKPFSPAAWRCPPRPRRPSTTCSPRARVSSPSRAAQSRSRVSTATTSATSRSTASSASPTPPSPPSTSHSRASSVSASPSRSSPATTAPSRHTSVAKSASTRERSSPGARSRGWTPPPCSRDSGDDRVRARHTGAEVAHHPRAAQHRHRRRLPRRRRQRCHRPARRRCRHLRRLRRRRRKRCRRRRPA